jgi:hypothetical protein
MSNVDILKKLRLYKTNPNLVQEMTPNEIADIALLVMSQVNLIDKAIKEGRLDGKTPQPDKDYMSKESALKMLSNAVNDVVRRVDSELGQKGSQLDKAVSEAILRLQNGKDGIVTEAEIERAATLALSMLELPDFDALVTEQITSNSNAIRDALELLSGGDRYKVEIADVQGLEKLLNELAQIRTANGGTIGKQQVFGFIRQAIADGIITSGGSTTFLALTDTPADYTGQAGKYTKVNATEDGLEFDVPAGPGIVETIVAGTGISVDATDPANPEVALNSATITSLGKADTATQPADIANFETTTQLNTRDTNNRARANHTGTQLANTISDFDTAVAANSAVAANTAKVTNATHTGEVTGSGALTLDKTAVSNRVDTVITASDVILFGDATDTGNLKKDTVQGILDLVPAAPTRDSLGLDTDDSPQFAAINLGHASDTTIARVSAGVASIEGNNIVTNTSSPTLATITTTGNIELGNASDTTLSRSAAGVLAVEGVVIPSISSTNTLTNKRVTPRVSSETSSATPTINVDNVDAHSITALAAAITSMTTNLSGTPTNFQKLIIRIKDDGTARAITWGASFEAKGVALPTTTVISKVLTVGFIYDTVTSKWGCVASAQEA